jgi:hypothetical protein
VLTVTQCRALRSRISTLSVRSYAVLYEDWRRSDVLPSVASVLVHEEFGPRPVQAVDVSLIR